MTVNGLELPRPFVEFYNENRYTDWHPKGQPDAYGNPLESDFGPLHSVEGMEEDTAELVRYSPPDLSSYPAEVQRRVREEMATERPGFLAEITDFSKIVQFGRTGSGAPYCFDFRDNPQQPSVIHFGDRYGRWRRLAPDFVAFISLFERYEEEEDEEP